MKFLLLGWGIIYKDICWYQRNAFKLPQCKGHETSFPRQRQVWPNKLECLSVKDFLTFIKDAGTLSPFQVKSSIRR
jgi:hypothetical protein